MPGTTHIALTVADAEGRSATATQDLPVGETPELAVLVPALAQVDQATKVRVVEVHADGSMSPLPRGYQVTLSYTGDPSTGSFGGDQTSGYQRSSSGNFIVKYPKPGETQFQVTVANASGFAHALAASVDVTQSSKPRRVPQGVACIDYDAPASVNEDTYFWDCSGHELEVVQEVPPLQAPIWALVMHSGAPYERTGQLGNGLPDDDSRRQSTLLQRNGRIAQTGPVKWFSSDSGSFTWDDGTTTKLDPKQEVKLTRYIHRFPQTSETRLDHGIARDRFGAYRVSLDIAFDRVDQYGHHDPQGTGHAEVDVPVGSNLCGPIQFAGHTATPVGACFIALPRADGTFEYATTRPTDAEDDVAVDIDGLRLRPHQDTLRTGRVVLVPDTGAVHSNITGAELDASLVFGDREVPLPGFLGDNAKPTWKIPPSAWDLSSGGPDGGPATLDGMILGQPPAVKLFSGAPLDATLSYDPQGVSHRNGGSGVGVTLDPNTFQPHAKPIVITAAQLRGRAHARTQATIDSDGFEVSGIDVPLGPVSLENARFGMRLHPTNVIYGGGDLSFHAGPIGGTLKAQYDGDPRDPVNHRGTNGFQIVNGSLDYVGAHFKPAPPLPVGGLVQITDIGAYFSPNPFNVQGTVALSNTGPEILTIDGCLGMVWGQDSGRRVKMCGKSDPKDPDPNGDHKDYGYPGPQIDDQTGLRVVGAGTLGVNIPFLGNKQLANAWGEYRSGGNSTHGADTGAFNFGAHLGIDLPFGFSIDGDIGGHFAGVNDWGFGGRAMLSQDILCVWIPIHGKECVGPFEAGVGASNRGFGACGGLKFLGARLELGLELPGGVVWSCDDVFHDLGIHVRMLPDYSSAGAFEPSSSRANVVGGETSKTVTLPGHAPTSVIAVSGTGGAPELKLDGPGVSYQMTKDQTVFGQAGHRVIVVVGPDQDIVYVQNAKPGDRWTISSSDHPIAKVVTGTSGLGTKLSGRVTGRGAKRTLRYQARIPHGTKVLVREVGDGVDHALGALRSGGGVLRFTPAAAPGRARRIVATATVNGVPRDAGQTIGTFHTDAPRRLRGRTWRSGGRPGTRASAGARWRVPRATS